MTEEKVEYQPEELNEHRQGNFFVLMALPFKFLKKKGITIKEYAMASGELLAKSWIAILGAPLSEIAKPITMNYAALGANDITYEIEKTKLTVKIKNWPPEDWLEFMEVTREDLNEFNTCWKPIASILGMRFDCTRTDNDFVLIFSE